MVLPSPRPETTTPKRHTLNAMTPGLSPLGQRCAGPAFVPFG